MKIYKPFLQQNLIFLNNFQLKTKLDLSFFIQKRISVVDATGIIYPRCTDGGKPLLNGLMDPRQGCPDRISRFFLLF